MAKKETAAKVETDSEVIERQRGEIERLTATVDGLTELVEGKYTGDEAVSRLKALFSSSEAAHLRDKIGELRSANATLREDSERRAYFEDQVEAIKLDELEAEIHEEDFGRAESDEEMQRRVVADAGSRGADTGDAERALASIRKRLEGLQNRGRRARRSAEQKKGRLFSTRGSRTADKALKERAERRARNEEN